MKSYAELRSAQDIARNCNSLVRNPLRVFRRGFSYAEYVWLVKKSQSTSILFKNVLQFLVDPFVDASVFFFRHQSNAGV
jgi:hypothetical protein